MSDKPLIYTPYDGSSKPFTIGLPQLDPARWIEPKLRKSAETQVSVA